MLRKAIAVDFDGTLFTDNWPDVGEPIWPVINKAKEEQAKGAGIILWTCRGGEYLEQAVEACKNVGLIPDAVNATLPEWLEEWEMDTRKVGATEYWDDRAVNVKDLVKEIPWISVEDRLPERERSYLTYTDKGRVHIDSFCIYPEHGTKFWVGGNGKVTHWMPLPEPPKEA